MESSVPVIYHCITSHLKLSSIGQHYAWNFMGQKLGQRPPGINSFCSIVTGILARCFEWIEMSEMAQFGSYVWGLCSGCWLCTLFFISHLLELECLRGHLHSHVWCLPWDSWNDENSQTSFHVAFPCGQFGVPHHVKISGYSDFFMAASFPQSIKSIERQAQ